MNNQTYTIMEVKCDDCGQRLYFDAKTTWTVQKWAHNELHAQGRCPKCHHWNQQHYTTTLRTASGDEHSGIMCMAPTGMGDWCGCHHVDNPTQTV